MSKNKKCKKCGFELDSGYKVCPSCGTKVNGKKGCGCAIGVVVFFMIIGVIASAGDSDKKTTTDIEPDFATTSAPQDDSNTGPSKGLDDISSEIETEVIVETDLETNTNIIEEKDTDKTHSDEQETESTSSKFILKLDPDEFGEIDTEGLDLRFGDLISVINGGNGVVVVKAKISPSYSNKATIDQNYYSVCEIIRENGFDTCSEIQYWAVDDMTDGSESKVISFTLDSDVIQKVKNGTIIDNQLGNYVDDLYILPSLNN